jgi:hypothetical protein
MNPGTGQQTSTLDSEASEPSWEAGDSDKQDTLSTIVLRKQSFWNISFGQSAYLSCNGQCDANMMAKVARNSDSFKAGSRENQILP